MDIGIIGIGIAVTFAIIALSAITLYLSFRIREIFREGSNPKTQIVKTAFLIGILFLAGGLFYFFAQSIPQAEKNQSIANDSQTIKPEPPAKKASVLFDMSYPDSIKTGDKFKISFNVYNPSSKTIHDVAIKLGGLSLSEAKSNFNIDSNMLNLGDLPPGETTGTLILQAPSKPSILEDILVLTSKDFDTVTKTIKINIMGDYQHSGKTKKPSANKGEKSDENEND